MLVDLLKSGRNLPEGHDRLDQVIGLEATLDQESQRLGLNPRVIPTVVPQRFAVGAARDDLDSVAMPLPGQVQSLAARVVGRRDDRSPVASGTQGIFERGIGAAGFEGDIHSEVPRPRLYFQSDVTLRGIQCQIRPVALSRCPTDSNRVDHRHPPGPGKSRRLRYHQSYGPQAEDGDPIPQSHGPVLHRPHRTIGRIRVHEPLRRDPLRDVLHPAGIDCMGLAHAQVAKHAVAHIEAIHTCPHLGHFPHAHVAQSHREAGGGRFAAPVQP